MLEIEKYSTLSSILIDGTTEELKGLLIRGYDQDLTDDNRRRILCYAAGNCASDKLSMLIEFNFADAFNSINDERERSVEKAGILVAALSEGHLDNYKLLCEKGFYDDLDYYAKSTVLPNVARYGDKESVESVVKDSTESRERVCLERSLVQAAKNARHYECFNWLVDNHFNNSMHRITRRYLEEIINAVAEYGDIETLKKLGGSIKSYTNYWKLRGFLISAAKNKNGKDILEFLVSQSEFVINDRNRKDILMAALVHGHDKTIEYLLLDGGIGSVVLELSDVTIPDIVKMDASRLKRLLSKLSDADLTDKNKISLLGNAALSASGSHKLKMLLEEVFPRFINEINYQDLFWIISRASLGHVESLKLIFEKFVNLADITLSDRNKLVGYAIGNEVDSEALKYLLEIGFAGQMDRDARKNAMDLAIEAENVEALSLLLKANFAKDFTSNDWVNILENVLKYTYYSSSYMHREECLHDPKRIRILEEILIRQREQIELEVSGDYLALKFHNAITVFYSKIMRDRAFRNLEGSEANALLTQYKAYYYERSGSLLTGLTPDRSMNFPDSAAADGAFDLPESKEPDTNMRRFANHVRVHGFYPDLRGGIGVLLSTTAWPDLNTDGSHITGARGRAFYHQRSAARPAGFEIDP
jgi:hypothetical protein